MADEIDRAQANDEFFLGLALKNRVLGARDLGCNQTPASNPHPLHCEDCGEKIPEARRQAQPGCTRCLACQTEFEHIHTHWRAL